MDGVSAVPGLTQKDYEQSYQKMFDAIESLRKLSVSAEILKRLSSEVKYGQSSSHVRLRDYLKGDGDELERLLHPEWSKDQLSWQKKAAWQAAHLVATGNRASQLAEMLLDRTKPMRWTDIFPTPEQLNAAPKEERIQMMTFILNHLNLIDSKFWGMTKQKEEGPMIHMQKLNSQAQVRAAYLHEIFHALSLAGFLPNMVRRELLTHAVTAYELVGADEPQYGLSHFGGELYVELFELGARIYEKGENLNDIRLLLYRIAEVASKYAYGDTRTAGLELLKYAPRSLAEYVDWFFQFERLAGTVLGGYVYEKQKEEDLGDEQVLVVGIAKRKETLIIPLKSGLGRQRYVTTRLSGLPLFLIQRLRDEAHRFARRYHHELIKNDLLSIN